MSLKCLGCDAPNPNYRQVHNCEEALPYCDGCWSDEEDFDDMEVTDGKQ